MAETELTPKNMLEFYVRESPQHVVEQVEMIFQTLGTKDAIRLLAYQITHLTMTMQSRVAPGPTLSIDDAKTGGSA